MRPACSTSMSRRACPPDCALLRRAKFVTAGRPPPWLAPPAGFLVLAARLDFVPLTGAASVRSAGRKDRGDRLQDNADVHPERHGVDVEQVQLHPSIERHVAPAVDLPETGKPRLHREPPELVRPVLLHLG